jgi:N-acetylmuramoyl-L-alanine amidase
MIHQWLIWLFVTFVLSWSMPRDPVFTRRLLLGHGFGAALILPASAVVASARPARHPAAARTAPLVVLDPGHGGKDPGAIGVSGTYEKHIAFAAAGELARQLRASGRYRVSMTRENDVFIPLEDRVAIAQAHGAALFVSLHADAVADHSVRGASVYTLAATASDAQSAKLAAHENAADHYGGAVASGVSPQVAEILASLVRHETRVGSAHMQQQVVAAFGRGVPLLENPSRHAGFAVLKAADIPSVLVEMGFMSNPHDEAALRQQGHRAMVASALHRAIDGFFAADGATTRIG